MSETAYNEEVTAETLNNIGVDLGQTEFSYFEDNMPYAVHQLNQITSDLVSSGVLRTGDDGALGCEVIASGEMAYVQPGVIVFASGAKIRITQPVGVDLVAGTYIYAIADSTTGNAKLEASETEPTGDYVMLAAVDADGVLADRRSSCVAKVMITADAQNVYREYSAEFTECTYESSETVAMDVGSNAFSYVYLKGGTYTSSAGKEESRVLQYHNLVALADGESASFTIGEHLYAAEPETVRFSREGQYLNIRLSNTRYRGKYLINFMVM